MRRALVIAALALPTVVGLLVLNYFLALHFLRLEHPADPVAAIGATMQPTRTPLVFVAGGHGTDPDILDGFRRSVGLPTNFRSVLPSTHPCLLSIDYVGRANPYPPLLAQVNERAPDYFSYGYLGTDSRYHQITYYWGEADTTPSILVQKVRGRATHWGDYFIRYTVYLSNDPAGRPVSWNSSTGVPIERELIGKYPQIDRLDWSTYAGGSYDGLEELGFAPLATLGELAIGIALWALGRRRKRTAA